MAKRRQLYTRPEYTPEDIAIRRSDVEALYNPNRIALQDIPIDRIRPNPFQARRTFDNIEELADSIRQQGFITRLRLRPAPGEDNYFELVYGERRLQAAKLAGLAMIPCEIAYHSDDELIEIGLVENVQRQDLDPLDEAAAFRQFLDHKGYTIARLADRIGKSQNYIEARLALLRVPADVREMIKQRPDTMRVARDIARLDTPEQRQPFIEKVLNNELNAQEVRRQTSIVAQGGTANDFFYSQIETDALTLQLILQRWMGMAADEKARKALVKPADDLLAQVEKLMESLQG
jgi:ParB family chromosome partitioning protein